MKFLTNLDLNNNQIQNVVFHLLSAAPTGTQGKVYFHTTDKAFYGHNDTSFLKFLLSGQVVNADINASAAIAYSKLNLATSIVNADISTSAAIAYSKLNLSSSIVNADLTNTTIQIGKIDTSSVRLDTVGAPSGSVSLNSQKITNLATPTSSTDAATKAYVDSVSAGLDPKGSVRAATTANITLSGTQTIDGVSIIAGDRVLVKNQDTTSQNGIYVCASGSWSRASDMDSDEETTSGIFVFVEEGTTNADSGWVLTTNNPITLDSTSLSFTQFSGAGQITAGDGLTKSGNTLNVATASSSRIVVNSDSIDLATTAVTPDTYTSVTVDAYGRVTAGSNPGGGTIAKYSATIGDGSNSSLVVTHNLNTTEIVWSIRQASDDAFVECDGEVTDADTLTLSFAVAPSLNALKVVVIG